MELYDFDPNFVVINLSHPAYRLEKGYCYYVMGEDATTHPTLESAAESAANYVSEGHKLGSTMEIYQLLRVPLEKSESLVEAALKALEDEE